MKIIRNFQVFLVLMFTFLCVGIGMNDVYAEDNNGYQGVYFNGEIDFDFSKVNGLDWDAKNGVLTMDGYNGPFTIWNSGESMVEIEIVVKGENNLEPTGQFGIGLVGVSVAFKGDGTLNISGEKLDIGMGFYNQVNNCVTIDGPTINILGGCKTSFYLDSFKMISGTLNIEMILIDSDTFNSAIYVSNKAEILGGTIIVNYIDKVGVNDVYPVICLNDPRDIVEQPMLVIDDCTIIAIGDLRVTDKLKLAKYDPANDMIKIGENFNFLKADSLDKIKAIDISKFKASLSETKFKYDGKAKTPEVKVAGLVEGKDFTVKYIDNINPGKATVIITGKGFYTGEINLYFEIESDVNVPKVGSEIKDADYTYKVVKAGTADGKVIGEVKLVGLNNKKLKKVKVATTVTINNVKYKVTEIGAKAFKNNKKIKSVVIGKNVKKIGKQAFYKCKKLKKITIKSKKLKKKSIGANAFKGIYKKAKFKVPVKKLKLYKKLIKKAKAPKKCKITK